jgi:hypothetical protein
MLRPWVELSLNINSTHIHETRLWVKGYHLLLEVVFNKYIVHVAVDKQGDKGTLFYIIFTGSIKVSSCDIHELAFYNFASLNLN